MAINSQKFLQKAELMENIFEDICIKQLNEFREQWYRNQTNNFMPLNQKKRLRLEGIKKKKLFGDILDV